MQLQGSYYIGIDVGTGSARACIVDEDGEIVGLASEDISTWQSQNGHYVSFHLSSIESLMVC